MFKFSSEFTHIGYISTFFSSTEQLDVVFGSNIGPYLLSTENFNELKYEIITTMLKFFAKIYMASISKMLEKIFCDKYSKKIIESIEKLLNCQDIPERLNKSGCKKCAYYEYCYI